MNIKKYEKYVDKMCHNIKNKLGEETEEFDFFLVLVNTFNEICIKNEKLENVLDEIENFLNKNGNDLVDDYSLFSETSFYEKLKEIIQKVKGE